MTHDEVIALTQEMNLPYAYDHFAEGESPNPPFLIIRYPSSDNFAADGLAYFKVNRLNLELYTNLKSPETELTVEAMLDQHGLFYDKSEVWIDTEQLYEVLYEMEV